MRLLTMAGISFGFAFSGLLVAHAGQGPSQWCSDNVGTEVHLIDSPVTLNAEAGGPVGPQGWSWIVCVSPTAWGDGSPAPTGGAVLFGTTQGTSGGSTWVNCGSDNNSTALAFGCNNGVGTNLSNPTAPAASVNSSNGVTVLGTPVNPPPVAVGTHDCSSGPVAVSVFGCANGEYVGASGTGDASSSLLAVSGTGTAYGSGYNLAGNYLGVGISATNTATAWTLAASSTGCAGGNENTNAVSGTNCAIGGPVAISGLGDASSSLLAISGNGTAYGAGYNLAGTYLGASVSGTNTSTANNLAISGTGCAGGNPNTNAVSGTNCAIGGPVAISGLGDASSNLLAVSGLGSASGDPGIAVAGGTASGRDIAISGLGAAQNSDGSNKASLLTVSGGAGETWVGDELIFLNTGLLLVPTHEDHVIDFAYMPPAEVVAAKEQVAALLAPGTAWNIATGLTEPGEGMNGESASTMESTPCYVGYCPPRSKVLSDARDDGQDYCNSCVPASVRTVLLQMVGWAPSEETLGSYMGTGRTRVDTQCGVSGTPLPAAAKALNRTDQNGNRMYQNLDTFYPYKPKDAADYMNRVTTDIANFNHGLLQGVNPARLPWFEKRDGSGIDRPAVSDGRHTNVTYGYGHNGGAHVHVIEVWNPLKLRWSQQRINNTFGPNRNPYGPQRASLARMWTAITQMKNPDGSIAGIVW